MERIPDRKMKGIIIYETENQPEKMNYTSVTDSENGSKTDVGLNEELMTDVVFTSDYESTDDDDEDDDDSDMEDYSDMDELPSREKGEYKLMSVAELVKCQDDDINNVSNVLSISTAEATMLLLYCNWSIEIATERWLSDAMEIREEIGLPEIRPTGLEAVTSKDATCGKCSAPVPEYLCGGSFCGHKFCQACWQDFISHSLRETNLILKCPNESCDIAVNHDTISMVASEQDQKVYKRLLLRSYILDSEKGKWCPTPGCNHAVILVPHSLTIKFTCKCLMTYCYRCLKEAHQPVSCSIFESWRLESLKQSPNWRLACTRQCPKCFRSVETLGLKNKRVECKPCSFHFCATCGSSWLEHGCWVGDQFNHVCPEDKLKENSEIGKQRTQATKELVKYQEYSKQWMGVQSDQELALAKVRMLQRTELQILAEKQGLTQEEVSFTVDAWMQLAECKRVFKWACVYDFYFLEIQPHRRTFFNTMIKFGLFVINQLGKCATEGQKFVEKAAPAEEFADFRERLCLKTRVAKNFFENLEIEIKNGCHNMAGVRYDICNRESIERKPVSATGKEVETPEETDCPHCTFPSDHSTSICVMCYH